MTHRLRTLAFASALLFLLPGCAGVVDNAVYDTLERFGVEKRHILADRIEDGREDQQEAQEQFQTTLDAFQALTGFDGGELEDVYQKLQGELEDSEDRAQDVRDRIASIEEVAADLFEEWEFEVVQISDARLRGVSQGKMDATKESYGRVVTAMKRAADRMDPVLTAFNDRVLFLKHDLNASAIASLDGDLGDIRSDVESLIDDMNLAIAEADEFLAGFER